MSVLIAILYISNDNEVLKRGSFPLRGKKKEEVTFMWWRQIRREMPYWPELVKVVCDGEDVTEKVKELNNINLSQGIEE
jgi:hypothetical protein